MTNATSGSTCTQTEPPEVTQAANHLGIAAEALVYCTEPMAITRSAETGEVPHDFHALCKKR